MKEIQFPTTIAYNMLEKKVGCVIVQAVLGARINSGLISRYFEPSAWELNPTKCKLFTLKTEEEFKRVMQITNPI